jgi:hypothetical protein
MHKVDLEKELGQLYRPNAKEVVAVWYTIDSFCDDVEWIVGLAR